MRYRLQSLHPALADALGAQLAAAGHEAADERVDALAVGLGAPASGVAVLDVTPEQWADALARMRAAFAAVRDLAFELTERGAPGRIVVVVDPSVARVAEGGALSAVPGAFLTTIAQIGAVELGPHGIAVNALVAGWMAPAPAALADGAPNGRLADPQEVARACAFLLSEQAAAVTGATLVADGGWFVTKSGGGSPLLGGSGG